MDKAHRRSERPLAKIFWGICEIMKLFDIFENLSYSKKDYPEDPTVKTGYIPYMGNKYFSFFVDSIMHSNIMNQMSFLDKDIQYDYYFNAVRKNKRFSKWHKFQKTEDCELVMKHFSVSSRRANQMIELLSDEYLDELRVVYEVGVDQINKNPT